MRGKFIVIEGLDGSGKSTQAKKLAQALPNSLLTREPSDGSVGSLCRAAISKQLDLNPKSLMMLMIADRVEHLEKTVNPALDSGQNVICDRYYLSNMAYQAIDTLPMREIYELNKKFEALKPDMTIFLSLEPKEASERIKLRGADRGIFDDLKTLEKINDNYQRAIAFLAEQGEKMIEISATAKEDEIALEILKFVSSDG